MSGAVLVILFLLLFLVLIPLPSYVIGKRRGVENAWVAFIPVVGATIVMLWSIERSGWMSLIAIIPLVGLIWSIWFAVTMPAEHGRTRWWALAFFLLPLISYYWYAFTLDEGAPTARAAAAV